MVMGNQRNLAWRGLFPCAVFAVTVGCDNPLSFACTSQLVPSLFVEVRDAETGEPAAWGVTGLSNHNSGVRTELAASDQLRLEGNWIRELAGQHTIELRRPGFEPKVLWASVDENRCHVETTTVQAEMNSDPRAEKQDPIYFSEGPEINAWPASAGVQMWGDTLEIRGFAPTMNCMELHPVAFQLGRGLHVQIEPSNVPLEQCVGPRQFEVRYILPPETHSLLVTNGVGFPVVLFDGQVSGG
jgi:hypothetical protein